MADDLRDWFRSSSHVDAFAHPDSPAGGTGSGFSRVPGHTGFSWSPVPHPNSPAGRQFDWQSELPRLQLEERFTKALQEIDRVTNTSDLSQLAKTILGTQSFDLGVCYGIAENATGIASASLGLARMFVLAGLYNAAHLPSSSAGSLMTIHLGGKAAEWVFGSSALKTACDQRNTLIRELGNAVLHPRELVGTAAKNLEQEYATKWKRFQQIMGQTRISANFEAGKIFGGVLVDVLILISTVGDIAKATKFLAELPELMRLSRSLKGLGRTTGAVLKHEAGAVRIGKSFEESKITEGVSEARGESPRGASEPTPPVLPGISAAQTDLAASFGKSDAHIAARTAVAEAFYRKHRFDEAKIKSELMGIDLKKPVKARLWPPHEEVVQWQPKGRQGRYFGNVEEKAEPRQLGIGDFGREPGPPPRVVPKVRSRCRIENGTPVLESTASKINDTWSVPSDRGNPFTVGDHGMVQEASGGATQYFIPDERAVSLIPE